MSERERGMSRCYWCGGTWARPEAPTGVPWADQGFCSAPCGEQFALRYAFYYLGLFGYQVPGRPRG